MFMDNSIKKEMCHNAINALAGKQNFQMPFLVLHFFAHMIRPSPYIQGALTKFELDLYFLVKLYSGNTIRPPLFYGGGKKPKRT